MRLLKTKAVGATVCAMALCPVMDLLALATPSAASVYRNRTDACLVTLPATDTIALSWSPTGRLLAVVSRSGDVAFLHVDSGEVVRRIRRSGARDDSSAASASASGKDAPTATQHRHSLTGTIVDACWLHVPLAQPLADVERRVLPLPPPPTPQPGTSPTVAALQQTIVGHALQNWVSSGFASVLVLVDDQGGVSLIMDGLAEIWSTRLPSAAGRVRRVCATDTQDVVLVLAPSRGSPASSTPASDADRMNLAFVRFGAVLSRCTQHDRLKAILVDEYSQFSRTAMLTADAAWTQSLTQVLGKSAAGAENLGQMRASLLGFLFRPNAGMYQPFAMDASAPPSQSRERAQSGGRPSIGSRGRGGVTPGRTSTGSQTGPAGRRGRSADAPRPSTDGQSAERPSAARSALAGRTPSPGNRGAGRGLAPGETEIQPLSPSDAAALVEQIQNAYGEATTAAIDQALRAVQLAQEYASDLVPNSVLEELLGLSAAGDANNGERSQRSSGERRGGDSSAPPRQSITAAAAAAASTSRATSVPSAPASPLEGESSLSTLPTVLAKLADTVQSWHRLVAEERSAMNSVLAWASRDPSRDASAQASKLSVHDFAAAFKLLTLRMPDIPGNSCSYDQLAVMTEVFASPDDNATACTSDSLSTPGGELQSALDWVRCCSDLRVAGDQLLARQLSARAGSDTLEVHEGLTVAETADLLGFGGSDNQQPQLHAWSSQSPPIAAVAPSAGGQHTAPRVCESNTHAPGTPGKLPATFVCGDALACATVNLTVNAGFGYMDAKGKHVFDPCADDVAAALIDRAPSLKVLGVRALPDGMDGPGAVVVAANAAGSSSAASGESKGDPTAVTLYRLGMPAVEDEEEAEAMPTSTLKLVVPGLAAGLASSSAAVAAGANQPPVQIDVAPKRGFLAVVVGQRYALVDLDDNEDEGDAGGDR